MPAEYTTLHIHRLHIHGRFDDIRVLLQALKALAEEGAALREHDAGTGTDAAKTRASLDELRQRLWVSLYQNLRGHLTHAHSG